MWKPTETPDEAEPKRNDLYDTSSQSESENEQYQVWRNVNNVFAVSLSKFMENFVYSTGNWFRF